MTVGALKEGKPLLPKSHDMDLAKRASSEIASFLSKDKKKDIEFILKKNGDKTVVFFLSPPIVDLIFKTLVEISNGNAVTLVPIHAELTTQEASNLLNVSRPFLIRLLEEGKIPFRKIGKHRRILFADLFKYKEKHKEKSKKAREALTDEAQELGLGY